MISDVPMLSVYVSVRHLPYDVWPGIVTRCAGSTLVALARDADRLDAWTWARDNLTDAEFTEVRRGLGYGPGERIPDWMLEGQVRNMPPWDMMTPADQRRISGVGDAVRVDPV